MSTILQCEPWPPLALPPMFPDPAASGHHWNAVVNVAKLIGALGPSHAVTKLVLDAAGEIVECTIKSCDREVYSWDRGLVGWVDDPIATQQRCILRAIRWPDLFARGAA